MPDVAWHPPADVCGFPKKFNITHNATIVNAYRRAYYASVMYQDYNIGRVLNELETLGHKDDTVVLFTADHGWQLYVFI